MSLKRRWYRVRSSGVRLWRARAVRGGDDARETIFFTRQFTTSKAICVDFSRSFSFPELLWVVALR